MESPDGRPYTVGVHPLKQLGSTMNLILQTFRLGVSSLLLHKMRSGLAVVGITIGIVAVIWLVAVAEGAMSMDQAQERDQRGRDAVVPA